MQLIKFVLITFMLGVWLTVTTGCSTTGPTREEQVQLINQFIVENKLQSVDRITTFRFYSWNQLSDYHLIISTSISKPYLIELKARCQDLRFAQAIKVNQSGASLQAKFDSVRAIGSNYPDCYIKSIYPLSKEQAKSLRAI